MKTLRSAIWIAALLLLFVPSVVYAQGPQKDIVVGGTFTLHKGETYAGDLVAIGSVVILEEGSIVEGNVVLVGGSLEASGKVTGDMASLGGSIHLSRTAEIAGDLACIGSTPALEEGAKVTGQIRTVAGLSVPANLSLLVNPADFPRIFSQNGSAGLFWMNPLFEVTAALFRILILSAIAVLVMMFLPAQTDRISRVVVRQLGLSLAVGILTLIAAAALAGVLILTCCLSPIGLLGGAILVAALVIGWVGMGLEIGKRISPIIHKPLHPAAQAGIGTMILTFVASGVWYFPCLGFILIMMAVSLGLGAVVLTRFGGYAYPASPNAPAPLAPVFPPETPITSGDAGSPPPA